MTTPKIQSTVKSIRMFISNQVEFAEVTLENISVDGRIINFDFTYTLTIQKTHDQDNYDSMKNRTVSGNSQQCLCCA